MAATTLTCSVFKLGQPKVVYKGDQSVSGRIGPFTNTGAIDVIFLAKVPHGATIVDFYEYHSSGGTTSTVAFGFDLGVVTGGAGGASVLIQAGAQATMNRFSIANWKGATTPGSLWPPTISLSDVRTQQYATLKATYATGMTATVSNVIWFTLIYRMDGPQPAPPGAQADVP